MANPNHLDNFVFNVTLDPPPSLLTGFSTVLLIAELATSSLNGDKARTYSSPEAMQTDVTAGFLAAAIKSAGDVAFAQRPRPASVVVGAWDRVGAEAAPVFFDAVDATGLDWYGACAPELRSDTPGGAASDSFYLDAFSDEIQLRRKIFAIQSPNTEIKGAAGLPTVDAGLAATYGSAPGRTMILWHSDDTEYFDVAYLTNRLAFDADETSVPWDTPLKSVTPYITSTTSHVITDTEKSNLDANNVNHGLELGTEQFFVDPGVMLDAALTSTGTPIYEVLTRDWFLTRLEERMARLKNSMSLRGKKITIDGTGQALVRAEIEGLFDAGSALESPHFQPGQTQVVALAITTADRDAQRLRFQGSATFAVSARKFTFNLNFTRQLIITS